MSNNIDTTLYETNSSNVTPIRKKNWTGYTYSTNVENNLLRCGPNFGACPNNQCCSTYGYCGSGGLYCAKAGTTEASYAGSHSNGIYNDIKPSYNTSSEIYDGNLEDRLYFTLLHKNINNCNPLTSTNMTNCNNYYNNASNNINKRFAGEYNNANSYIYSNPTDPILTSFEANNDSLCTPQYGKNRKQLHTANYTFPIINTHSDYIKNNYTTNNIQSIKNLSLNQSVTLTTINGAETVIFTRINDTYPEMYRLNKNRDCPNNPYRTEANINSRWTTVTGCTQPLTSTILSNNVLNSSYDTLQYLVNQSDVDAVFNPYTKMNLYKEIPNSADKISTCYNGYVTYTRDDLMDSNSSIKSGLTVPNKINKGMFFRTGPTGDILILRSSSNNWELWLNTSGQLIISNSYTNFQISERIVPVSSTTTNSTNNIFTFQTDGNVVLWHNGNVVWSLGTVPIPDANHLHLTNLGHLVLLKANNQRERLVWDNTKNWLRTYFYDNSPHAMFADKKGRFFKFTWSEYSSGYMIHDVLSNNCCNSILGEYNSFRGWGLDGVLKDDNSGWNVTQRNLININGYDRELNTEKPNKNDTPDIMGDNYCTKEDRDNFFNDGGTATINTSKIRKPIQFTTGGFSKSNYLPGYIRISYVNGTTNSDNSFKFLIMDRGASQRNQAFVLFQKFHDRNTFADSVFGNHPDLVDVIQNHSS
jgi:hypothetical protein